MGCNSLLNNYCFAIILIAKMLVEKYFLFERDIFRFHVTFHRWLGLVLLATAILPRFLVAPSWCRSVGSPQRAQDFYIGLALPKKTHVSPVGIIQTMPNHLKIFETWRDLLKAKRFHLYLSSYFVNRYTVLPAHSKNGRYHPSRNKMDTRTRTIVPWNKPKASVLELAVLCAWTAVEKVSLWAVLLRFYVPSSLSVKDKLWSLLWLCWMGGPQKIAGTHRLEQINIPTNHSEFIAI